MSPPRAETRGEVIQLIVAAAQDADSGYGRHAEEQDQKIIRRRGADGAAAAASAVVVAVDLISGAAVGGQGTGGGNQGYGVDDHTIGRIRVKGCLLYTSDAADE